MIDLLEPVLGKLTQGVIFSCAYAERYKDTPAFGLIVTARCDLAQDKFPVLNYVPVVPLTHWLANDGFEILLMRSRSDIDSRISSALKAARVPESVLLSQTPRGVLDSIFNDEAAEKDIKKAASKFSLTVELHEELARIGESTSKALAFLCKNFISHRASILRELVKGSLTGHYFLPRVSFDETPTGYVALLREVTNLPRELGLSIASGLGEDDITEEQSRWRQHLSFANDKFAMPVGEVPSPQIEHIMQTFSSLFARIGLRDYRQQYIDDVCAVLPEGVSL